MMQGQFGGVSYGDGVKQRRPRVRARAWRSLCTDDRGITRTVTAGTEQSIQVKKATSEALLHHLNGCMRQIELMFNTPVSKTGDPEGGGPERKHPTKGLQGRYLHIVLLLLIIWKILFSNIFSLRHSFQEVLGVSLLLLNSGEFGEICESTERAYLHPIS